MSTTYTHDELMAEARRRFGDDPLDIAFVCPSCGDVATVREFHDRDEAGRAGQECIGRQLGPLGLRGCNWVAYGLIPGPWTIDLGHGKQMRAFALAPAPEAAG